MNAAGNPAKTEQGFAVIHGPNEAQVCTRLEPGTPNPQITQAPPPELDLLSQPDMLAALTQPRGPAAGPGSEPGSQPAAANGAIASWTSFDDPSPVPRQLAHATASYEDPNPYPTPKAYPGASASTSYPDERTPADANPLQGPQTAASLPSSPTAYGRAHGRTARRSLEAGSWAAVQGPPSAPSQAPGGAAEPARGPSPDPARDPAARPDAGLAAPDQALQGAGSLGGAESGLRDAEEAGSESSRLVLPGIARCAPCAATRVSSVGCADVSGAETHELGSDLWTACKVGGCKPVSSLMRGRQQEESLVVSRALSFFCVVARVRFVVWCRRALHGPCLWSLLSCSIDQALPVGRRLCAQPARAWSTHCACYLHHLSSCGSINV